MLRPKSKGKSLQCERFYLKLNVTFQDWGPRSLQQGQVQ